MNRKRAAGMGGLVRRAADAHLFDGGLVLQGGDPALDRQRVRGGSRRRGVRGKHRAR